MRIHKLFKTIMVLVMCCLFTTKATADDCPNAPKLMSAKVHLEEFKIYGTTFVDDIDVEFWTRSCNAENQLMATVTPKVPGKSTSIGYTLAIIQNGKQESIYAIGNETNLHVPTANKLITNLYNDTIDYGKPFQIILQCRMGEEYCNTNQKKTVNMTANSTSSNSKATINPVNGLWYDPAYDGLGFNILQTDAGTFVYYYGYKGNANGQSQWLASSAGPKTIVKGKTFTLEMSEGFLGNGASFTSKPTNPPGIQAWGTAEVTFNSCQSGTIKLSGQDGTVTHNVIKLIAPSVSICVEN